MPSGTRCCALVAVAGAAVMWACGGDGPLASPSPIAAPPGPTRLAVQPSDYHEPGVEPDHPVPAPAPVPEPDPALSPAPGAEPVQDPGAVPGADPMPGHDHGPVPPADPGATPPAGPEAAVITIVGSFGPSAFAPNPITATVGQTITWTNTDAFTHHIMLADGTMVGTLAPGESSVPIAMTAATVSFVCTIHPSMVGTAFDPAITAPMPDPTQPPGYDYQDPYGDDYGDPYGDDYDDDPYYGGY